MSISVERKKDSRYEQLPLFPDIPAPDPGYPADIFIAKVTNEMMNELMKRPAYPGRIVWDRR